MTPQNLSGTPTRRDFPQGLGRGRGRRRAGRQPGLPRRVYAAGDETIKIALIGCGGRGTRRL